MTDSEFRRAGLGLLIALVVATALFRLFSGIDLWVAGLFYDPSAGFVGAGTGWQLARNAIWNIALIAFALTGILGLSAALMRRPILMVPARAWGALFALFVVAPGLLVNGFLKSSSGRARPAYVTEFGGDKLFTPAWTFTDQCDRNCSFVSGEVSGVVALAVVLVVLALLWRQVLPRWSRLGIYVLTGAMVGFVSLQRIAQGRHFLSDVTFAALLTLAVAWGLYGLYERGWRAALRTGISNALRKS